MHVYIGVVASPHQVCKWRCNATQLKHAATKGCKKEQGGMKTLGNEWAILGFFGVVRCSNTLPGNIIVHLGSLF